MRTELYRVVADSQHGARLLEKYTDELKTAQECRAFYRGRFKAEPRIEVHCGEGVYVALDETTILARRHSVSIPVTETIAADLRRILPELFAASTEFAVRVESNLVTIERKKIEQGA